MTCTPRGRKRPALTEQGELLLDPGLREWLAMAEEERPRVRGDCQGGPRPCGFVACRYHLWGERVLEFERLVEEIEPERWGDTCALDIADNTRPPKSRRMDERRSVSEGGGEVIGRPGPALVEGTWEWPEPPLDQPTESNRAVVGRFLGGLSRETVRVEELVGVGALRGDSAIAEAFPWLVDSVDEA